MVNNTVNGKKIGTPAGKDDKVKFTYSSVGKRSLEKEMDAKVNEKKPEISLIDSLSVNIAIILPNIDFSCIALPLVTTSFMASSRENTPDIQAETYSPILWPNTILGFIPYFWYIYANEYSTENIAGWVYTVCDKSYFSENTKSIRLPPVSWL